MKKIFISILVLVSLSIINTLTAQTTILEGNLIEDIFFIDSKEKVAFIDFAEVDQRINHIRIQKEETTVSEQMTADLAKSTLFEIDFSNFSPAIYTIYLTTPQSTMEQQVILSEQALRFVYFELVYAE